MRAIGMLVVCVLTLTCQRDVVGPKPPANPGTAEAPARGLSAADHAVLGAAITDAQAWLLPSLGERHVATDAIARRVLSRHGKTVRPGDDKEVAS